MQVAKAFEAQGEQAGSSAAQGPFQVSDVPLSAIWNSLARPGAADSSNEKVDSDKVAVEFRLFADPTDLAVARNISSTVTAAGDATTALTGKKERLSHDWGVIPVFTMAGMKIRTRKDDSAIELQPWFLSISSCVQSYKKASGMTGEEDASNASLHMVGL